MLGTHYFADLNNNIRKKDDYFERLGDIKSLIEVFSMLIDKFRSKAYIYPVSNLRSFVKNTLPLIKQQHDYIGYSQQQIQELELLSKELKEKQKNAAILLVQEQQKQEAQIREERKNLRQNNKDEEYKQQPPDDFQNISVISTVQELKQGGKPFLRAIPSKGGVFRNSHDYLDLIFRLLREDAIGPLRSGLELMQRSQRMSQKEFNFELKHTGCRLFDNVVVLDFNTSRNSQELVLTLRIYEKRSQNWNTSKRLLNGSLLMISHDNFNNLCFCIVVERDQRRMCETSRKFKYVDIQVQLITNEDNQFDINKEEGDENILPQRNRTLDFYLNNRNFTFQMIESTAYFESYNHVLHKLKEMDTWDNLPLSKYLTGQQIGQIDAPILYEELKDLDDFDETYNGFIDSITFGIHQGKFDQSQTQAIKTCLFKELAIVQGPPGTGKTYVGEHFVRILLDNKHLWRQKKGPILLVCYTNHALDQFLTLISKYTKNFVRFGGRCKEEHLKQHQIREYMNNKQIRYPRGYGDCIRQLDNISDDIFQLKSSFQLNTLGIVNSLIQEEDSILLLDLVFKWFKQEVNQQIKKIKQESNNIPQILEEVFKRVHQHFQNLLEKEQDVSMIFWLGIVDMQKYISEIWLQKINEILNPQEQFNMINNDDLDQREQDQQMNQKEKKDNKVNAVQAKKDNLMELYNPITQHEFYRNAKSYNECIQIGLGHDNWYYNLDAATISRLTIPQRWSLNNYFNEEIHDADAQKLTKYVLDYEKVYKQKKSLETLTQIKAVKQADIVAMTTTGCAKFNDILRNQNFSIVIVEEAAEVFEAHILTSLSRNTEHLILIGDHQQLKPSPAVYELEKNYNLSMSMFERLVKNGYDYATLSNQRRMRPEISKMIKLLYPKITDDERVTKYPQIRGINTSVFFLDHEHQEDQDEGNMSKMNKFEAEMIEKFTFYLLQQNYDPNKITILSLYMAQSFLIKKLMMQYPKDHAIRRVKVITVDNFQGEENDIIILSLVRSNQKNEIGYLKISNRVCVALSRAKHGMFIFGNATCLYKYIDNQSKRQFEITDEHSQLWVKVLSYLKENQFIGQALNLCCVNHKKPTYVKLPQDFQNVPEGGCKLPCEARMLCGHTCQSLCHFYEPSIKDTTGHDTYKCCKNCERQHPCGHKCTYKCFDCKNSLQPCQTFINKNFIECKHTQQVKCYEKETAKCKAPCAKIKPCGHQCQKACFIDCSKEKCGVNVVKKLPCGHLHELKCSQQPEDFVKTDRFGCPSLCGAKLDCGHLCKNKCGDCHKQDFHPICQEKIDNVFQCGHVSKETCGRKTILCMRPCETKCVHSKCPKLCFEPCTLCNENCEIQCEHSTCGRKCSQPCDKPLCKQRCQKLLKCEHQCIGLCGDKCPDVCKECEPTNLAFDIFFGTEQEEDALFVKIDCGHILEASSLDQFIETQKVQGQVKFAECPKCKTLIKKCLRYYNYINQTLEDMNHVKTQIIKKHNAQMENYKDMKDNYKQLVSSLPNVSGQTLVRARPIFKSWEILFNKAENNESLLNNCAIKLELLCFIVSFGTYIYKHDNNEIPKNRDLYSFCQVSINQIIKHKFVLSENIKEEMRKMNKIIEREIDFKATVQMIAKAMNLGQGHFYKCPNGHFYTIGECGGAMQQSKCPDCGAVIGGSNHSLASGNQHANIDGSSRPAWDPHGFDQQVIDGRINLNDFI